MVQCMGSSLNTGQKGHFFEKKKSIFCKTLQARLDKTQPNLKEKEKETVVIFFHFPYCGDEGFQLLKHCIHKIKVNSKNQ